MKILYHFIHKFYFPVFLIVATIIYCAQKTGIVLPTLVHNYMNDFLCIPIVLFICQWIIRFIKSDYCLRLPLPLLIVVTLFYSWYFEWFLPQHNTRYTTDLIDVFLYFFGLLFFYLVEYGYDKKRVF